MSERAIPHNELHTIIENISDKQFPKEQLRSCGSAGLFHPDKALSPFYLFQLASISIPTAFVLSQYRGAAERIALWSTNNTVREEVFSGTAFATLGISQLSTSHQHTKPPLIAQKKSNGWHLKGFAPWVTGAHHAQYFILGAIWNNKKVLFCVHKEYVQISAAPQMITLNQCDTAQVHIDSIVDENSLLHIFGDEPATQTGSLRSIAIAMGVTEQSINLLKKQATRRPMLQETQLQLNKEHQKNIISLTTPDIDRIMLRIRANQLALQSAQQALVACKGKGLLVGEKAGELCTQALFFLVWSCPQSVQNAHLNIGIS
tara:strand:+ start:1051 stop:2001 length:951 start_codon:yes stop_codon:yes gene_type:complete